MKQKVFWLDLALCSAWALAAFGSRINWGLLSQPILFLLIYFRVTLSFVLYRGDKRAWLPLAGVYGLSALCVGQSLDIRIPDLVNVPLHVLDLTPDFAMRTATVGFFLVWIWVVPAVVYVAALLRKKLERTSLKWKHVAGGILWHDRAAQTYLLLFATALLTLYAGLAMNARVSRLVCIAAPALSYYLLARHYGMPARRFGWLLLGMLLFFQCQTLPGLWRIGLLVASFVLAAYVCSHFYRNKGLLALSMLATLYTGIILPTVAIGNNPYTCINYGRSGFYPLEPYRGIFIIEDRENKRYGLRDRYGLLVEPAYEEICYHDKHHWFGKLELRKNGYYVLYDICNNSFQYEGSILRDLQDRICSLAEKHMEEHAYAYDDRLEIKVTNFFTDELLSHIKVTKNGEICHHYEPETFIPGDTATLHPDEFVRDSLVQFEWSEKQALAHATAAWRDSDTLCRIQVRMARRTMPPDAEAEELANRVADAVYKE